MHIAFPYQFKISGGGPEILEGFGGVEQEEILCLNNVVGVYFRKWRMSLLNEATLSTSCAIPMCSSGP